MTGIRFSGHMRPNVIRTHRPLWARVWRMARMLWLHYEIDSAEQFIAQCAASGITNTNQIRYQKRHVETLRVRLAIVERN